MPGAGRCRLPTQVFARRVWWTLLSVILPLPCQFYSPAWLWFRKVSSTQPSVFFFFTEAPYVPTELTGRNTCPTRRGGSNSLFSMLWTPSCRLSFLSPVGF